MVWDYNTDTSTGTASTSGVYYTYDFASAPAKKKEWDEAGDSLPVLKKKEKLGWDKAENK